MSRPVSLSGVGDLRHARWVLVVTTAVLALIGVVSAESADRMAAYELIMAAAFLPAALWLRAGAPGIPVLPVAAAMHYLYYAVPILRANEGGGAYTPWEVLRAAATVVLFLFAATIAWRVILGGSRRRRQAEPLGIAPGHRMTQLMFVGLAIGIVFELAVMSGWLGFVGSFFGVVRAVALSVASIACFVMGHVRARGLLRGQSWVAAAAAAGTLIILSWDSLFLVGGMEFVLAALLGYSITAKRIPWVTLFSVAALVFVLHAGKAEMRARYWPWGYSQDIPVTQMPGAMGEWIGDGVEAIVTGDMQQGLINRAALLYMLLNVERLTPNTIPYLGGKTYALLPTYLIPRFIDPEKINSQAGLALLNIRYGIQTRESNAFTTIGWGIIAEAFANFGYIGVFGVGILFGALAGWFTRWSAGAPLLSLPALLSIAALVTLTNLEADLGYLLVNLWQALAATLLFFVPIRMLAGDADSRPLGRAVARRGGLHLL